MCSVKRFVEMDIGSNEMKEALLDLRRGTFLNVGRRVDKVVVRCVNGGRFLKLAEEELVPAFIVTLRRDGGGVVDAVELGCKALLDLVHWRSRSFPSLGVKETPEGPFEFDLPLDTDEVEEKTVDNFRIGKGSVT